MDDVVTGGTIHWPSRRFGDAVRAHSRYVLDTRRRVAPGENMFFVSLTTFAVVQLTKNGRMTAIVSPGRGVADRVRAASRTTPGRYRLWS